jgi:hypothetical protein
MKLSKVAQYENYVNVDMLFAEDTGLCLRGWTEPFPFPREADIWFGEWSRRDGDLSTGRCQWFFALLPRLLRNVIRLRLRYCCPLPGYPGSREELL